MDDEFDKFMRHREQWERDYTIGILSGMGVAVLLVLIGLLMWWLV